MALTRPGAEFNIDAQWSAEVAAETVDLSASPDLQRLGAPEGWPDYQLRKAQLPHVARALRAVVVDLPGPVQIETEVPLCTRDGRLRGQADFVIRGSQSTYIVDIKTGPSSNTGAAESHERQIQLYAYLLGQAEPWPDRGLVLSFADGALEVDVGRESCEQVAAEALALLSEYNSVGPDRQPASPSTATCPMCPYGSGCSEFWNSCDQSWASSVLAVRGRVTRRAGEGPVTVWVAPEAGTLPEDTEVAIRAVDAVLHPAARTVEVGQRVGIVGLTATNDSGVFRLPPSGALRVAE